jgi:hypothetical protein
MSGGQHRNDEVNGAERRVNVKRKKQQSRAINQALLRRHTGVLRKSKNQDKTFLTKATSLEMFATLIWKSTFCEHEIGYFLVSSHRRANQAISKVQAISMVAKKM